MKKTWLILAAAISTIIFSEMLYSQPTSPSNVLVFTTIRPSFWEIYLIENGKTKQLTQGAALNYNPTFSPDGNWLIFSSEKTGTGFLYALDLRKQHAIPQRLTKGNSFEDTPSLSFDGKFIYYMSTRDKGIANIFKIPFQPNQVLDQSKAENLTNNNSSNLHPAISPDGSQIVFSSNRDSKAILVTKPRPDENYRATDLYLMNADGSNLKRLTNNQDWTGSPSWSLDGKTIFFYAVNNKIPRIYSMNKDGTNVKPISPAGLFAVSPTPYKSGRIAFAVKQHDKWQIASTTQAGSDFKFETDESRNYWAPAYHHQTNRLAVYGQAAMGSNVFYDEVPQGSYMDRPMAIGPFSVYQNTLSLENQPLELYAVRGYFPNYLPKQNKIASVSKFSDVVLSNLDGSSMQQIYQVNQGNMIIGLGSTENGDWLTIGSGIPFSPMSDTADIWKFRLNGKDAVNLTASSQANNTFPRLSVDGRHIIFRSGSSGNKNIYRMNSDGNEIKQLTSGKEVDTMPDVSVSGNKIVFSSVRNGENYRIYLLELNTDGTVGKPIQLTNGPGADVHPTFSPDGKWIAFSSEREGFKDESPLNPIFSPQPYGEVYLMRLSDKKIIALTDNKWEDSLPNWRAR